MTTMQDSTPTGSGRRITCRYLTRDGNQCTGEAADAEGEITLCLKHLARAFELIQHRMPGAAK
jgi:hypothetical protein